MGTGDAGTPGDSCLSVGQWWGRLSSHFPVPRSSRSSPHTSYYPTSFPLKAEGFLPGPQEEEDVLLAPDGGQCVVGSMTMISVDGRAT